MHTQEQLQRHLDYIEQNLQADISVEELCRSAGYSYAQYCRLFRHYVGTSPVAYITRRKLLHAVCDIAAGVSETQAALCYGFTTYAGFYKAFRREFGCSPGAFLKEHRTSKPYRINIFQEEPIVISKKQIQHVLTHWHLQREGVTGIFRANTGRQHENAYSVGEAYILKISANLGRIQNALQITHALQRTDVPTAAVVQTTNGADYVQDGELYFLVTTRISGAPLKCAYILVKPDIAFSIGINLAKLHAVLKKLDEKNYTKVNLYENVMQSALPKVQEVMHLQEGFVRDYISRFGSAQDKLPRQIIHRDVNPSNMLFENGSFKAFVDFELSEINARIFDIGYCCTSILSECFSDLGADKENWFAVCEALVAGYESVSPLSMEEKQALPYMMYSIQMLCIAYFSQFDKYDALAKINIDILNWMQSAQLEMAGTAHNKHT